MFSANCPSVDTVFTLICSLYSSCFYCFVFSSYLPVLTIICFVFFRPKLIFFSFPILAQLLIPYVFCFTCFCYVIHKCWHSDKYLTISIFYFSSAVNCGCFCISHDGSKYCALFYHFFDLYILCVSYWCSNYYICFFVCFI